ncbi:MULTISPECIES: hypothetical protein [unclassified Citrobacter]|uniref:hypothetical protein n=1 Tax=unclassified Citrobacter TaxID=2644389 RepID=UPI0020183D39|nr:MULTISPECIES: hypothetical protein [unclassified Citrobacter]
MFQKDIENAVVLVGDEMKKSDNAWLSLRKKRQRIDLKSDGNILFLEKGAVSVHRVENDLVMVCNGSIVMSACGSIQMSALW